MKLTALAFAALLLLPAAGASAQDDRGWRQSRDAYARYYDRGCVPLCQFDRSPCDPIQFKIADGRCEDPFWGD